MKFFTAATALIATVLADGCNDTGGVDTYGDGCDWYATYGYCDSGYWDHDGFTAADDCCTCGGGCIDTPLGATDIGGDPCDWYWDYVSHCGSWDDNDFWANLECCACGGGVDNDDCQDQSYGGVDSYGDGCDWYADWGYCDSGYWDDSDFVASAMCCACGAGLTYDVMVYYGWA